MVTSISGNNVTWRDSKTGNLITDVHQDLEKVMAYNRPINNSSGNQTDRKRTHRRRRKVREPRRGRGQAQQSGGYLSGPSHEQGGIPATFQHGGAPIELEGGEYIINAQTVDAVGQEFLDELNSTQTSYHQGGFESGELPSPSQYRNGGKINNRSNLMRRGGRPTSRGRNTRRMQQGGHAHNLPAHTHPVIVDGWGRLGPQHEMFASSSMPDNYNSGVQGGSAGYVYNTGHARTGLGGGFEIPWNVAQTNPDPWMFQDDLFGDGDWLNSGGDGGPHNHPGRTRQQMTMRNNGNINNGRDNMRRGGRPTRKRRGGSARSARAMKRGGSARPARAMRRGGRPSARPMRRGGVSRRPARSRKMMHGGMPHSGMNNSCPQGMHMMNGSCMNNNDPSMNMNRSTSGGGYGRGGRPTSRGRRMEHGGHAVNTPTGNQSTFLGDPNHGILGGTLNPHATNTQINYGHNAPAQLMTGGRVSGHRTGGQARGRRR